MTQTEPWTVGRLLAWTVDYLEQHGGESPRLDAEVLLAEARGCDRIDLYTAFNETTDDRTRTAFRELVRRRAEGAPVAYLVGRREFYSLSFRVTPDVLIPRPETELVVVALLDLVKASGSSASVAIADVGTGSGAIAVAVAKHCQACQITAIDVSQRALDVATRNVADHGVADRVELALGNLLADLPADHRFNYIVSNPPYVTTAEWETLAREVKDHEPQTALVAGPRGTEVIEPLVAQAAERLRPGGWLIIELSPMIVEAVEKILAADGRFSQITILKDIAGLPRVVQAQRENTA